MHKNLILILGILCFFCFIHLERCQCQTSTRYQLRERSISASGGAAASGNNHLKESILGGLTMGMSTSNSYILNGSTFLTDINGPLFEQNILPKFFELQQNFPNPFNPTTTIQYNLPKTSNVIISIYNTVGQIVRRLNQPGQQPGTHQLTWDGRDDTGQLLPSGVYLYQIDAGGFTDVKKMLLMK